MANQLIVHSDVKTWKFPLRKASLPIGSSAALELRVPHDEMIERAATIDNRGESPLIINHNEFPIYVGAQLVEPGAGAPWPDGDVVQLTKSISLELTRSATNGQPAAAAKAASTQQRGAAGKPNDRQIRQMAVIAVCLLIAVFMMLRSEASQSTGSNVSFDQLLNDAAHLGSLDLQRPETVDQLLTALQDAHVIDLRWRHSNPHYVVNAYNRLLQTELVRRPTTVQQELASDVKLYGSQRIQALWKQMDYR